MKVDDLRREAASAANCFAQVSHRRRERTTLLWSSFLVVAGFVVGTLFQKYYGAGTALRMVGLAWLVATTDSAVPPLPRETGLPDPYLGKLSLFVLAGQSNMSGRGELPRSQAVHPRIFLFGNDYRWKQAREPLDDPEGQVDKVSVDSGSEAPGFGPGMAFALAVAAQRPDLAIGLIPCAKGDTIIHEWQRSLNDSTLYGSCLKRVKAATVSGEMAGLLFFQGEADALDPQNTLTRNLAPRDYAARFSAVIKDLRADLALPDLPVVFAQIGTHTAQRVFTQWGLIREQQQSVRLHCSAMIRTDDLALRDSVHFTTESYQIIGQRFAAAYLGLTDSPDCQQGRTEP